MSSCFCVAAGITAMAWSLEGKLLVVGTQEGMVAVCDMEEQQVIHILPGHTGEAQEVGFMISFLLESHSNQSVPWGPFTTNSFLCIKTLAFVPASASYSHITKHPKQKYKLVQPLWRIVWRFLKKLKIKLPYDPAVLLLGIYLGKTII